MNKFIALTTCALVVGCASNLQSSRHYTLDLEHTQICYGSGGQCLNLELIIPSHQEHQIARAYQLPSTNHSWDVTQLVNLMLAPPNALYTTDKTGPYTYRLPANNATDSVWYHLEQEQYELYESNGKKF